MLVRRKNLDRMSDSEQTQRVPKLDGFSVLRDERSLSL